MIEILQGRSEAYSSWSEKNVNDSDHSGAPVEWGVLLKNVDKEEDGRERRRDKRFRVVGLWKS
jgi:hypothetical protein